MRLITILLVSLISSNLWAQVFEGQVLSNSGEPIPFAAVGIPKDNKGVASSDSGFFSLKLSPGKKLIQVSAIGYLAQNIEIEVADGQHIYRDITLKEDLLGLEEVVITGTMTEKFLKASPVKVEVITGDFMRKNLSPTNLVEGVTMLNGVQEVVACGVCFTNSISINGLPGQYTAVLIDGSPIYGNLASVYGLNGISAAVIDRIEIIRGPSSTLYGSEAMAGVINIITKKASDQPALSADIMLTSHMESFGNAAAAIKGEKGTGLIGVNYSYINDFDDWNDDGFGDIANLDRWSLFSKWEGGSKDKPWRIFGKLYYEDRRNGVEEYLKDRAYRQLRGSEQVYGESIYTYRAEILGTAELSTDLSWDYSASWHVQDSYYGADWYKADQKILFSNLKWQKEKGPHQLLSGLTFRYQYYDDNTVATELNAAGNQPENQFIPGVFLQDEYTATENLNVLGGLRLDFYDQHGVEFSPRLSLKYNPWTYTTFRFNSGTGFKVVNLFTEDHAFVTGQRQVVIEEELLPERSINFTLNANHVFALGESQGMFDVDVFHSRFSNKITPDYSEPGLIIYANGDGFARTAGVGLSLNHQMASGFGYTINANFQRAEEQDEAGNWIPLVYAPEWTSALIMNYSIKPWNLDLAYTVRFTGPMALPEVYDVLESGELASEPRPVRSQPFGFQNIQLTKQWNEAWESYLGIQNMFNYRQSSPPLVGFNDPNFNPGFSPSFDTSYAYSPIHGREIYLGLRWKLLKD